MTLESNRPDDEKRSVKIALAAVMTAFVTVTTFIIQIPTPPTHGYINIGDAMIFTTALTFGPYMGGVAGGFGSALSDLLGGYGYFAPFTLIIKGCEGLVAGLISNRKSHARDLLAVLVGGVIMIMGYFSAEAFLLGYGVQAALTEVPGNTFQIVVGGVVGIPIATFIRKRLPSTLK